MKIINARTESLQPIPFELGESGRGRWLEKVQPEQGAALAETAHDFFALGKVERRDRL